MPALVTFFSPIILGPEILIITRGQSGAGGDWVGRRVSSQLPWEAEIYSCLWAFIEQNHRRVVTKKRPGGISALAAAERSDKWSWFSGITGRATGAQKHFDWRCPQLPSIFDFSFCCSRIWVPPAMSGTFYFSVHLVHHTVLHLSVCGFAFTPFLHCSDSWSYMLMKRNSVNLPSI